MACLGLFHRSNGICQVPSQETSPLEKGGDREVTLSPPDLLSLTIPLTRLAHPDQCCPLEPSVAVAMFPIWAAHCHGRGPLVAFVRLDVSSVTEELNSEFQGPHAASDCHTGQHGLMQRTCKQGLAPGSHVYSMSGGGEADPKCIPLISSNLLPIRPWTKHLTARYFVTNLQLVREAGRIPIPQMRTLRLREVWQGAWSHTAGNSQS